MTPGLRARMEEAVLLPGADPVRRQVEAEVRAADAATRSYWDDLLAEDVVLREELARVQVPVGLEGRLARLPDAAPRRAGRGRWIAAAAALAAAALLFAALWATDREPRSAAHAVAQLAAESFVHDPHIALETADAGRLERELTGKLPFAARLPAPGGGFVLAGGRGCRLAGDPVAFSVWKGPDDTYALFQFVPRAFDLDGLVAPAEFTLTTDDAGTFNAVVWTEDGRGYVVVSRRGTRTAAWSTGVPR